MGVNYLRHTVNADTCEIERVLSVRGRTPELTSHIYKKYPEISSETSGVVRGVRSADSGLLVDHIRDATTNKPTGDVVLNMSSMQT